MNTLKLKNVHIKYIDSPISILEIENVEFNEGLNFIVGKNGCGKSTLLKAITSDDEIHVDGEILYNGKALRNDIIGIVSQNPINRITPELTFVENLIQSVSSFRDLIKPTILGSTKERLKVIAFLESFDFNFDISQLYKKESSILSLGQQQLLAILMRVYRNGKILLLDECTASLDELNTKLIIDTISKIAKKGVIILFVTHQQELLEIENSKKYLIENKKIKL